MVACLERKFCYFLVKFIDPSDFQMCEMDTDSAYLAISGKTLDEEIRPEKRQAFEQDGIVALCSKTYYCFGAKGKNSCKGFRCIKVKESGCWSKSGFSHEGRWNVHV